jgi:signal transduction histidine kinase
MDRMIEQMERSQMIASERERIGRELHDGTIQSIYGAGLALEDAALAVGKDADLAQQKIHRVMDSLNSTIGEIRGYIHDLRPETENGEFEKQLRELTDELPSRIGVTATVEVDSRWRRPLPPEQTAHLLQVAREALANTARHSGASRVLVQLNYGRKATTLKILDDGRGFEQRRVGHQVALGQGQGLPNLSRRLEMLGGSLRIKTGPGRGTMVIAEVPVSGEAA